MKSPTLFTASAIIAGAAVAFGATALTFAQAPADNDTLTVSGFERMHGGGRFLAKGLKGNLTEEQKAEFEATREEMENRHEQMETAIEAGDYEAWKALQPENSPMLETITAENFARFAEMHRLLEEAGAIAEELGLPGHHGFGMGNGLMMKFKSSK